MVSGMGWLRPWAIMVNKFAIKVSSSPKKVASCSREIPLDSDMSRFWIEKGGRKRRENMCICFAQSIFSPGFISFS